MADPTARINANKGGIAPLITTEVSMFEPQMHSAHNIFAVDDSAKTEVIGQKGDFGQVIRFPLRKRGGRICHTYLDVAVTVPTTPDPLLFVAAWVDDLGANLIERVSVKYSSKTLQEYSGEFLKFYQRLMDNDITKEHYNGNQLAGLSGVVGENIRSNIAQPSTVPSFLQAGNFKLRIPLDWLWFTKEDSCALATEALASEIIIEIKLRRLEDLVYARAVGVAGPVGVNPFGGGPLPTITLNELYHELIFTPKVEASRHLARYENRQGLMFKILDIEEQLNFPFVRPVAGAPNLTAKIKLDNFRLDSQFIFFVVRDARITLPWTLDRASSDNSFSNVTNGVSTVTPAPVVLTANLRQSGALIPIKRARMMANGSVLVDWHEEFENRGMWRKKYFPGSQINGAVYFIPFAKKLREHKDCHGYQNMSNLGSVTLEVELETSLVPQNRDRNPDCTNVLIDVYNVCHNVIQMAEGDVVKALR